MSSSEDYLNAISEFYKLKNKYDIQINKQKRKIITNSTLSNKQKRSAFQLLKPKCIKCKKPVGTKFIIKNNILNAVCGSISNPCSLNIYIDKGKSINLYDHVEYLMEEKDKLIIDIIKVKLDLLFNYTTEEQTMDEFKVLKDKYSKTCDQYETFLNDLLNIIYKLDSKEESDILKLQMYEFINNIKENINLYKKDKKDSHLQDAINIYINELLPSLEKDRKLKYAVSLILEKEETCNLYTLPYIIQDLDIYENNVDKPNVREFSK